MIMRDTVFTLSEGANEETIRASVEAMVKKVQAYVPGYRLKQEVQFERYGDNNRLTIPGRGEFTGIKTSIFLEVEGAGDYLPSYSGNLDIDPKSVVEGKSGSVRVDLGGRQDIKKK